MERVSYTPEAAELLRRLRESHGPLMFHQSGGCCDGSSPMCYPAGEFRTGGSDVLLIETQQDMLAVKNIIVAAISHAVQAA